MYVECFLFLLKRQQIQTSNTRVITSRMNKATGMAIVITRRLSASRFAGVPVVVIVATSGSNAAHSSEL